MAPLTNGEAVGTYFPEWEGANQVFEIANCFQNVNHDMANWTYAYCITKTIEWVNFLILSILIGFLLALHCIMYKRVNKRWSFLVFKRNRVQILTMSLLMTSVMFVKMTFMMEYADLVLLLLAQLFRFIVWSLTLINFMKSGMDLMVRSKAIKVTLRVLKWSIVAGTCFFSAYAIYLIFEEEVNDADVLSCGSAEFTI